jgi:UDPglucose 6-dehydrogenase
MFAKVTSEIVPDVDVTFICINETAVEEEVKQMISSQVKGIYVIRSTVQPGTTANLMKKYGVHICHNPEFLREKTALNDVVNPERIVIGQCCPTHGNVLSNLYSPLSKPIFITDPTTSELVKLTTNAYLSMLITFWNEIHRLTQKIRLNIQEVSKIVSSDSRVSKYGLTKFGEPFSGKCLPKDLDQLIEVFRIKGLNPILFESIKLFNERLNGGDKQ